MIGLQAAAKAAPDGYTINISALTNQSISSALFKNPPADLQKDFVPVALIGTIPHLIVVNPSVPAKNLPELITFIKSKKGDFNYASQGNGSTSHLTAKMFMHLTGTDMLHVPYKGSAPALFDLMAGNVDIFFDNLGAAAQFHESGKLRILAVADYQRSKILPQVPTFAEQKLPSMQAITFFTLVAPPGTSSAMVDSIYKSVRKLKINMTCSVISNSSSHFRL
jgi:tripartite-type tricarboxylate transporter receptor subunit TctC